MSFDNYYIDCLLRIGFSFVCGFCLGFERKVRQHTVGMRTLILISVSSTLLCMLSVLIVQSSGVTGGDPTRMAAGVVTGIGFLGGGAILRQGLNIRGLTSAAVIWTAAALGLACGTGQFFLAAVTLAVSLVSLIVLEKVEWRLFPAGKTKSLTLVYSSSGIDVGKIKKIIAENGFVLHDLNMSELLKKQRLILKFSIKAPEGMDLISLSEKLQETGGLIKISISDD